MNKSKVKGLKWNLKKLRGSVLHFTKLFFFKIYYFLNSLSKQTLKKTKLNP